MATLPYDVSYEALSSSDRDLLDRLLSLWERSGGGDIQRMLLNLRRLEVYLPQDSMNSIVQALVAVASSLEDQSLLVDEERSAVADHTMKVYLGELNKHLKLGGICPETKPFRLGRAATISDLKRNLYRFYGPESSDEPTFWEEEEVDCFLAMLISSSYEERESRLSDEQRRIFLSGNTTWVTWNENAPESLEPIDFAASSERVCANLGLVRNRASEEYILFVYDSARLTFYRPTIADAGSYQHFQPSSHLDPYGRTSIWTSDEINENQVQRRPESVTFPPTIEDTVSFKPVYPAT